MWQGILCCLAVDKQRIVINNWGYNRSTPFKLSLEVRVGLSFAIDCMLSLILLYKLRVSSYQFVFLLNFCKHFVFPSLLSAILYSQITEYITLQYIAWFGYGFGRVRKLPVT